MWNPLLPYFALLARILVCCNSPWIAGVANSMSTDVEHPQTCYKIETSILTDVAHLLSYKDCKLYVNECCTPLNLNSQSANSHVNWFYTPQSHEVQLMSYTTLRYHAQSSNSMSSVVAHLLNFTNHKLHVNWCYTPTTHLHLILQHQWYRMSKNACMLQFTQSANSIWTDFPSQLLRVQTWCKLILHTSINVWTLHLLILHQHSITQSANAMFTDVVHTAYVHAWQKFNRAILQSVRSVVDHSMLMLIM